LEVHGSWGFVVRVALNNVFLYSGITPIRVYVEDRHTSPP
jgi:hypothetical protein